MEFVERMGIARKYGKKVILDALKKQGYLADDDSVLVKKFKTYVAGLFETAKQDKDEADLTARLSRANLG